MSFKPVITGRTLLADIYGVPPAGGHWWSMAQPAQGSIPTTNARRVASLAPVADGQQIAEIGIRVAVAGEAGSTCRLAVYDVDDTLRPSSLIQEVGSVSTAAAAFVSVSGLSIRSRHRSGLVAIAIGQEGAPTTPPQVNTVDVFWGRQAPQPGTRTLAFGTFSSGDFPNWDTTGPYAATWATSFWIPSSPAPYVRIVKS